MRITSKQVVKGLATLAVMVVVALATYVAPYLGGADEKESSYESQTFVVQETFAETSSEEKPSIETEPVVQPENTSVEAVESAPEQTATYKFRSKKLLSQHYEKHGIEMGFADEVAYEAAASAVIVNPDALYKTEAEDGDGVYYLEATNEFVILSTDGYIRTYFYPSGGKNYFDRQ